MKVGNEFPESGDINSISFLLISLAMTGTHTQSPVFSRITLALMEDSGWYKANYSMASPLSWGKGLGCSFAMKSCKDWIYAQGARYYLLPFILFVVQNY